MPGLNPPAPGPHRAMARGVSVEPRRWRELKIAHEPARLPDVRFMHSRIFFEPNSAFRQIGRRVLWI
jgi:hypothetical protein